MKFTLGELKYLLSDVICEAHDNACPTVFKVGQVLPLHREVRVIPLGPGPDGRPTYFAGEPSGKRRRGETTVRLRAGTRCEVVKVMGGKTAWCKINGVGGLVRIDINKFCPEAATNYLTKSRSQMTAPTMPVGNDLESLKAERERLAASLAELDERIAQAEIDALSVDDSDNDSISLDDIDDLQFVS